MSEYHKPTRVTELTVLTPGVDDTTGTEVVAVKGNKSYRLAASWLAAGVTALVQLGGSIGINAIVAQMQSYAGTAASALASITQLAEQVAGDAAIAASAGGVIRGVTLKSGAGYVLGLSDIGVAVERSFATANTVTVPSDANVAWPANCVVHIMQGGAGATTISGAAGVAIVSFDDLDTLAGPGAWASLIRLGANRWGLTGNLVD